jgi:hypothetical protein
MNKKSISIKCGDCLEEYKVISENLETIVYCSWCGGYVNNENQDEEEEPVDMGEYNEYDE